MCLILKVGMLFNKSRRKKRETMCSRTCATTFCVKHKGTPTMATSTGHWLLCNLHASDVIKVVRGLLVPGNLSVAR